MSALHELLKKHRMTLETAIFHMARPFAYMTPPTHSLTVRHGMSIVRAALLAPRIGKMGRGVRIDSGVTIRGTLRNLEIGDYTYVDVGTNLEVYAPMRIGRYVHLVNAHIQSGDVVTIGDYAGVASGGRVYASSNAYQAPDGRESQITLTMSSVAPLDQQYVERAPVTIAEYAFVGANSVVLPGAVVGRGAVVAAGSVVRRDVPPYAVAIGKPARPVKRRRAPGNEGGDAGQDHSEHAG
jgi:acetyltransferase-like isoleucine patch superfamily enzyme